MKNFTFGHKLASFVLGTAAIISGVSAPAQAQIIVGALEFSDGTTSFIENFTGIDTTSVDTIEDALDGLVFDITFSPLALGGQAAVGEASGVFGPFFDPTIPPIQLVDIVPPPTGTFDFIEGTVAPATGGFTFEVELDPFTDITFNFDDNPADGIFDPATEVSVTFGGGSEFLGFLEVNAAGDIVAVEFLEETVENEAVIVGGTNFPVVAEELAFGQVIGAETGGFEGEVSVTDVSVPEPGSIAGLVALAGLGFGLKRRKRA